MVAFTPIEQRWLLPNQFLGLQFAEGWVFLRVLAREFTRFRPYTQGIHNLSADGTQDFIELKDPVQTEEKILDVTEDFSDRIIYHAGIGIAPDIIRVYVEYPTGEDLGRILSTDPTRLGDNKAYRTGMDSPYGAPTDAMEFFMPFTMTLALGFHNPDDRDHLPVLDIELMKYAIEVLRPEEAGPTIGAIARGSVPARLFTLGRVERPFEFTNSLKKAWAVNPIPLKAAKTLGVRTGGRA